MNFATRTIKNVFEKTKGNNLKARAARGSLILAVGAFFERGMALVRNMILARMLAPKDFGLMAIVLALPVLEYGRGIKNHVFLPFFKKTARKRKALTVQCDFDQIIRI